MRAYPKCCLFLAVVATALTAGQLSLGAAPNASGPTWRQTGEFPLIAGTWREAEENVNHGPILVTIAQHGGKFQADCTYQHHPAGEPRAVEVQWHMHGTISESGDITAILVPVKGPEGQPRQNRKGALDADGKIIQGQASWNDGGHNFTWTLRKPLEAQKLFVVKFSTPQRSGKRPAIGNRKDQSIEYICPSIQEAKDKLRKEHLHAALQSVHEE